jgi:phospholipid/cholesterol/gamma-HCH transport system permease protein
MSNTANSGGSKPSQNTDSKGKFHVPEGLEKAVDVITRPFVSLVEEIGNTFVMLGQALFWVIRRPFRWRQYLLAMESIGVNSLGIIVLVGVFVGAAFSLQTVSVFRMFQAESLIGSTVAISLCRELAPVLAGVMVTARAGSAMATELGSMRITEQIDALHTLSVNPIQYLVCPRIIATVIMLPLLTMVFIFVGIIGAYVVAVLLMHVDKGYFIENIDWYLDAEDIIQGIVKAGVFGLALSTIGCYQGYNARGGAQGVGIATTKAVVQSCVSILILDYFVTDILFVVES